MWRAAPTLRHPIAMLLALCALAAGSPAAAQPGTPPGTEPIVATDLLRIRQLGSVAVSPDGRLVVYTVRTIEPAAGRDGDYAYRTHLFLASDDGRDAPRQLTYGDQDATEPAWHPDGDRIAFVRTVGGTPQVFVLPLAGGEAYPLTRFRYGASNPRWSPDGTKLLFTATLSAREVRAAMGSGPRWPAERPGRTPGDTTGARPDPDGSLAEVRAWLDGNADDGSPRVFTRLDLQDELDLAAEPSYEHLFVVDADSAGAEPRALTHGYNSFSDAAWMADGEQIVFAGAVVLDQHPDRVRDRDLFVVRTDGTGFQPLLSVDGYALSSPVVSPQGRQLAFLATPLDDLGYAQTELGVVGLVDPEPPRLVTLDFDRSVRDPRWSDDGWVLYFVAPSNGGFPLYRLRVYGEETPPDPEDEPTPADTTAADTLQADTLAVDSLAADTLVADTGAADAPAADSAAAGQGPAGPRAERLTGFDRGVGSFDPGRATIFYVATEATNPYELYASNLEFTTTRRLTDHNARWLASKRLSVPEAYTMTRDTLVVDYWVMKPAFFEEGRRYPLLVQIHGGPSAMWGPGEASMWFEFQFFAARGYGVVFGNPRGSGGYGRDFRRANYRDWGEGPASDVLAVAGAAAQLPWIDPDRQVVTGGSYAGYLTAWIVAHDDRFKAAVAQRGVYDLSTFLGEGNAWRLVPGHFGGYPWETDAPREAPAARDPEAAARLLPETAERPPVDSMPADSTPADSAAADSAAADSSLLDERSLAAALLDAFRGDTTLVAAGDLPADTLPEPSLAVDSIALAPAPPPESVRDVLVRNSPLTYVARIRTPLLIIHGDNDLRTGVVQSEVLYKSLKILERPVEYVRYPNAGHELSRSGDPRHRMDRILRIYEFFERFL